VGESFCGCEGRHGVLVGLYTSIQAKREEKRGSSALVVWTEAEKKMWKGAKSSAAAGKLAKYL
jgi:hypothetical protein